MKNLKISFVFIVMGVLLAGLAGLSAAYDTNANFKCPMGELGYNFYFNTDLRMQTGMTLSLVSGGIVSGNPNNLQNGNEVCSGAKVQVTPSLQSKWALSYLDASSMHPGPTSSMIDYSAVNTHDIGWLSPAVFQNHLSFGQDHDFADCNAYSCGELSPVYAEKVTFSVAPGQPPYPNKQGNSNVFCKGYLDVMDGSTTLKSYELPASLVSTSVTLSGTTTHNIKVRLRDVSCFGIVKSPNTSPEYAFFFSRNPVVLQSEFAAKTIGIKTQGNTQTCSLNHLDNVGLLSFSPKYQQINYLVTAVLHNTWTGPIRATAVHSSNANYAASPFPTDPTICMMIGAGSLCPTENGFEDNAWFNPDTNKLVSILLTPNSGATGGTILTIDAISSSTYCNQPATCHDTIDLSANTAVSCAITPPTLEVGQNEVAELKVTCKNLGGQTVPCVGSAWEWFGMSGSFWTKDNTHALAYTSESPGKKGQIRYHSGIAECSAAVTVNNTGPNGQPKYKCKLDPSSATVYAKTSQYFTLTSSVDDVPATPNDAQYKKDPYLYGTLSQMSVNGVNFTATTPSAGDISAYSVFSNPADYPILGAECSAHVVINNVPPEAYSCYIDPPERTVGVKEVYGFKVSCRDVNNQPTVCQGAGWEWTNGLTGGFVKADNVYAWAYTTSPAGSTGKLSYHSGQAICHSNITVVDHTSTEDFKCDFIPPGASLVFGQSQYFNLSCEANDQPRVPDTADYSKEPSLIGTISNSSLQGTTFTAGNTASSGDLIGFATFQSSGNPPGFLGVVALAPIVVTAGGGPTSCTMVPSQLALGHQMAGMFTVSCKNINNMPVDCVGEDWQWTDGLSGGFVTKDNVNALAYPTSPVGTTGNLTYQSGAAKCWSNVTVTEPQYTCEFNPGSANLQVNQSQHFDLICKDANGTVVDPDDAQYNTDPGLCGSIVDPSTAGANFTACSTPSQGNLIGVGVFSGLPPYVIGAVAIAPIVVGGGGGNQTQPHGCTGPNCNKGSSEWCTIGGLAGLELIPGQSTWIPIKCGPNANETCDVGTVSWSGESVVGSSWPNLGTMVKTNLPPGQMGNIHAEIKGKGGCDLSYVSKESSCAELS